MTDHELNEDTDSTDADADFLRRWLARLDAADTSVRLPEDEFLRRWLTGRASEDDDD